MLEYLKQEANLAFTENGAVTNASSLSDCLDLFATVGAKILASKDAQKVYVYTTAAALREKEDVMAVVTNIKELAGDVLAGAKAFNEKRAAEQAEVIEDTAEKAE